MPRKPRKPGTCFWLWTRTVEVVSPGTGKRRVNSKMTELYDATKGLADELNECRQQLGVRDSDIEFLREALAEKVAQNKQLLTALHMDDAMATVVNMRTPAWSRKDADEEVDTVSLPAVSTN